MGYLIRTRDEFYLDGIPALSVGLAVEIPPVPPMAQQRYTTWQNGGDTPISVPDNEYDAIKYTLTARVIKKPYDFDNSEIYDFLHGKKILQISRLPDKHLRIQRILGITPKSNYNIYANVNENLHLIDVGKLDTHMQRGCACDQ